MKYAFLAIFISIVFVFTVIIAISIPATRGFWNIGETGVYIVALMSGPVMGALAGGIGSALADIFLGYAYYAPGTLVIKGAEGFLVGYLYYTLKKLRQEMIKRYYAAIMVFLLLGVLVYVFYFFGSDVGTIDVELASELLGFSIEFSIRYICLILFALAMGVVAVLILFIGKETYLMMFSCLVGGIVMVFGYFIYESIILGSEVALVEVIPNFMQSIIGIVLSIPVIQKLEEMEVIDKYKELMGEVSR